ncbi:hypothetical protein [Spiroplasma endosymbiont of Cantharis lateralis]|uniref:hypothetical protein n=1 Tax=Spiroplasma endosymbiont of Cantharis lateralis TaxID=3066277 RepID=UPI00313BAB8E
MDLLKKLIKEYEERLNNSLEIMKELNKELEKNMMVNIQIIYLDKNMSQKKWH